MRMVRARVAAASVLALLGSMVCGMPARADSGTVTVIFSKGGLILGVGMGEGVLTFKGRNYPFTVSGMSIGATIGASTSKLTGRALNLRGPSSIEGTYSVVGAGGALAGGAGGTDLQNTNGVILRLRGPRVGVELSAAVGGVTIKLKQIYPHIGGKR